SILQPSQKVGVELARQKGGAVDGIGTRGYVDGHKRRLDEQVAATLGNIEDHNLCRTDDRCGHQCPHAQWRLRKVPTSLKLNQTSPRRCLRLQLRTIASLGSPSASFRRLTDTRWRRT